MKLRALNTIEALNLSQLTPELTKKIKALIEEYDTSSSPEKYIYRAAQNLLATVGHN